MNVFPGRRIVLNAESLISASLSQLNPEGTIPIENLQNWVKVNNNIYEMDIFSDHSSLYLIYKHPIHDYLDRLYWVDREVLIEFMKERIDPDKEEGLDIIIVIPNSHIIVVCNHDGEIYQAKTKTKTIPPYE
jgi:hypothetical protein